MLAVIGVVLTLALGAVPAGAIQPGTLDSTFGASGLSLVPLGQMAVGGAVAVQPDGRIVTAGEASLGGQKVIVSTRMTSDGKLDPTYGLGGVAIVNPGTGAGMDSGAGLALQSNGDIVIAGTARSVDGRGPLSFAAVRLLPNGALDSTFGHDGVATVPIGSMAIANAVVVQPNGKIVLAGTAFVGGYAAAIVRLNAQGSLDRNFGHGGVTLMPGTTAAWGLVRQTNGELVIAGQERSAGTSMYMAARLQANGVLDTGFGDHGIVGLSIGSNAQALALALQLGGKIVLTGDTSINGAKSVATVRLLPNGSLDGTFGSDGSVTFSRGFGANAIAVDSAGRILIAGGGDSVVRLTSNGAFDHTFGDAGVTPYPAGRESSANGIALEPGDGKIILAGAADIEGDLMLSVLRLSG